MSTDSLRLNSWLSLRRESMFARPQMFGSQAEFEAQFLLMLEFEILVNYPVLKEKKPRYVLDKWTDHNRAKFKSGTLPAHSYNLPWEEFMTHVKAFQRLMNIAAVEDDFEVRRK